MVFVIEESFYNHNLNKKWIVMDRNNILIGALGGALLGAIIGAILKTEKGGELLDSAKEGIKNVSARVVDYAKQNIPSKMGTSKSAYQE
jgi:hypothetical protein